MSVNRDPAGVPEQTNSVEAFIDRQPFGASHIRIVALCGLVGALDGLDVQLITFVAPVLAPALHLAKPELGPIFASGIFGMAIGGMCGGPLADRIGRKPVILLALVWVGLCTILTGSAGSGTALIAMRFLTGLGAGAVMPNAAALTSEYAPKRIRATMVMVMYCGFSIGGALGGPLTNLVLAHYSWSAVFVFGGCVPLMMVPFILMLLPESLRFLVVSGRPQTSVAKAMRVVQPGHRLLPGSMRVTEETVRGSRQPVRRLFAEGRAGTTLLLWVMFFLASFDTYLLVTWLPTLLQSSGVNQQDAVLIASGFQIGGVVGALTLGYIIDRTTPAATLAAVFVIGSTSIFLIGHAGTSVVLLRIAAFIAGFCLLGAMTGLTAMAAALYPTSIRSTGVGWTLGIGRGGGVVGPLLGGAAMGALLTTQGVFQFAALPALAAAFAAVVMTIVGRHDGRREAAISS